MKLRLRLSNKVLLLIAVLLIFQLGYLAVLSTKLNEIAETQKLVKRTAQVLLLRDRFYMDVNRELSVFAFCLTTMSPSYKKKLFQTIGDLKETLHLLSTEFSGDESRKHIVDDFWRQHRLTIGIMKPMLQGQAAATRLSDIFGGPLSIDVIQSLLDGRPQTSIDGIFHEDELNQKKAEEHIRQLNKDLIKELLFGLCTSILLSLFSGVYFIVSITSRLKIILNNIKAIEQNTFDLQTGRDTNTDELGALERSVRITASALKEAIELQNQRMKLIAEELERPLADIGSCLASLLKDGFAVLNEKGSARLTKTAPEIGRLRRLVSELALSNSVNSSELDMEIQVVDLAEIARRAIDIVDDLAQSRKIKLTAELPETHVRGDEKRLLQIVINLLSNAIKFSPEGSLVSVNTSFVDDWGQLAVIDRGTGIDDSFKDKVFAKFEQGSQPNDSSIMGSGLGLAICKRIMEYQHGELGFDSSVGHGSTFWLRLPSSARIDATPNTVTLKAVAPKEVAHQSATKAWRPTLWKQGLVLISIPLVVQVFTVGTLYLALQSINENIQGLARTREIASLHSRFVSNLSIAFLYSIMYNITQLQPNKEKAIAARDDLTESVAKLNSLLAVDNSAEDKKQLKRILDDNLKLQTDIIAAPPDSNVDRWFSKQSAGKTESIMLLTDQPLIGAINHEEDLIAKRSLASEETERLLNLIFPTAACLSGLLSAVLAMLMTRKLLQRLETVVDNSMRLGARTPLKNPLQGDDELSLIDQCLFNAAEKLNELEQTRQLMVSVASHELRTPLSSLLAMIDLIQAGVFGTLTEEGEVTARKIKQTVVDLISLITNLLDLDKMQSGKQLVHKEECCLNLDIVQAVITRLSSLAQERQIELRADSSQLMVEADAARVVQALDGIVREFIESLPGNSVIEFSAQTTDDASTIKISAPNDRDLKKLPGAKSHAARQQVALDFAKSIVEQHGGHMITRSTQAGRMVLFNLPKAGSSSLRK